MATDYLNWDLYVLSRAIAYPNLSNAAPHIGLSQPQMSRIIVKLEERYGVTLLDRDAKRKSGWTPEAFKLVNIYANAARIFDADVKSVLNLAEPDHLSVGTLEGLVPLATGLCQYLFATSNIKLIELQIHDLSLLEEEFTKGNLDVIFSSREPGKKKFRNCETLGYQSLDKYVNDEKNSSLVNILSPFEFAARKTTQDKTPVLICNSLSARHHWLQTYGGKGIIPSSVYTRRKSTQTENPVLLIAHDHMHRGRWQALTKFRESPNFRG